MISKETKDIIEKVAANPQVQMSVVRAMFQECERGTDLWEWMEGDAKVFGPKICMLLWGRESLDEDGDDDDCYNLDCLANTAPPFEVIEALMNKIEENIESKLVT